MDARERIPINGVHPLQVALLAAAAVLFLGGFLSDWAYSLTYQVQWSNFSAWLGIAALPFAGAASLWAVVMLIRSRLAHERRFVVYSVILVAVSILGFINSLVHAKDAWAMMPEGLILSLIVSLLTLVAAAFAIYFLHIPRTR